MKLTYTKAAAAGIIALGMASNAYAVNEEETNHPIANAQGLVEAASHRIQGMMGQADETVTEDLDFYDFTATEGDVISIVANGSGAIRTIIIGVFDSNGTLLRMGAGAGTASITDYTVNASGAYTIGVSSGMRFFVSGGNTITFFGTSTTEMGDYTLTAKGITVADKVKRINIEVKPGSNELAPLNPRAKGKIPVAIYGGAGFDVEDIKHNSVTFGASGNENSLNKCQSNSRDINNDGYNDLICFFENSATNFRSGAIEGILRGNMSGNAKFEGRAVLKVIPTRRK